MPYVRDRVVVPIDFSAAAFAALDVATDTVRRPSDVYVVYVLSSAAPDGVVGWDDMNEDQRLHAALKRLNDHVRGSRYDGAHVHVATGEPGVQILKHAERVGADLIAIPAHSTRGYALVGSVAERVVRGARCPVLVLRS